MNNKEGLCEAEVRKNLVLAELGKPLTIPLATLNSSCKFKKEWDRIQKIWHKKKFFCVNCEKEFPVSKGRNKYCSTKCSKAYSQTPEAKAKQKAYSQTPEAKAKQKAYSQTPEVKAKQKAYYQKNKESISNKYKLKDIK